jgi:MFS family permease
MTNLGRPLISLVAAVAASSTAYFAVYIVVALAALQITGTPVAAGVPTAVAVLATALGVYAISRLGVSWGRPVALAAGFGAAVIGCGIAYVAVAAASLAWLVVAAFALGLGNAALQQARYAAADTVPTDRRTWALGLAVWGSTVGAVFGPNLLGPAEAMSEATGSDPLQLALVWIGILFVVAAGLSLLADRWSDRPLRQPRTGGDAVRTDPTVARFGAAFRPLFETPRLRAALAALVGGQLVMVLVMAMTPLHIREHGGDLVLVGIVISAHTLGMFALAPLSTWFVRQRGGPTVALSGMAVSSVAVILAAIAPPHDGPWLAIALFLLGFGWNLSFVAGSGMLAEGTPSARMTVLQGASDSLVFGAAALASIGSGALLAVLGYSAMALVSGLLLVIPVAVIVRERGRISVPVPA